MKQILSVIAFIILSCGDSFFLPHAVLATPPIQERQGQYLIDFSKEGAVIERISNQKAIIRGHLLQRADRGRTNIPYSITLELSGGPASNRVINTPELAGRGPTRFATNQEPRIVSTEGESRLDIRLLGTTGSARNASGLGKTFYRDPSSQTKVTIRAGERTELANIQFSLTGIDAYLKSTACQSTEPGTGDCGGDYIDRVVLLSGSGGYFYQNFNPEKLQVVADKITPVFVDANENGRVDHPDGTWITPEEGTITLQHPGSVGAEITFVFDDAAKGSEGDSDGYHDFDAPVVEISLLSGITFDLVQLPPPLSSPDQNLRQLQGVVFADRNRNGQQDSGENGIAAVEIQLFDPQHPRRKLKTAMTRAAGKHAGFYQFDGLEPGGNYRVEALIPLPKAGNGKVLKPLRLIRHISLQSNQDHQLDFAAWPKKLTGATSAPALSDGALLPDLQPLTHYPLSPEISEAVRSDITRSYPGMEKWYLDTETHPGKVLLRFGTLAVNIGTGPVHIVSGQEKENTVTGSLSYQEGLDNRKTLFDQEVNKPGQTETTLKQGAPVSVYQHVYRAEGSYTEHPAGHFFYHDGHDHVHLSAFEQYNLVDIVSDEVVATHRKVSFCLTDVLWAIEPELARAAQVATVPTGWECGSTEQSINVGYSDYYGPLLPDQWIDVTDVPTGSYWLEVVVDPENQLKESNESNNRVRIKIDYKNPRM